MPALRDAGIGSVRFNTVIKRDNLDQLLPIVERGAALGGGGEFSVYTDFKNGNREHLIDQEHQEALDAAVSQLLAYKRRRRGVITNSDYYLEQIPRYVRGEMKRALRKGDTTIHIDPQGLVRRCSDFPADGPWRVVSRL